MVSKGFSLLELLVALALFTFLFLFLTQMVRQNHRHVAKIKKDLELVGATHNSINLIKSDLSSVSYFLDLNYNFRRHFFIDADQEPVVMVSLDFIPNNRESQYPVLLDESVVFEGEAKEMEFVSYSVSKNNPYKQWIKIRYQVEDCPDTLSSGVCLMRYETELWSDKKESQETELFLVVSEGLETIQFSYSDNYSLIEPEWKDKWEPAIKKTTSTDNQLTSNDSSAGDYGLPLPARVQIIFQGETSQSFTFPVSKIRLKEWSSQFKGFSSFKKWEPKKEQKSKTVRTRNNAVTKAQQLNSP